MKKSLLLGAVIALCSQSIISSGNLSTQEKELEKQTEWLRGERSLKREHLAKGTAVGAATGAALLAGAAAVDPEYIDSGLEEEVRRKGGSRAERSLAATPKALAVGASAGATIGAMWSLPIARGLQWWQRRKINNAVNEHLDSNVKVLTKPQAMLVIAAYKRNLPMLKVLIDRQLEFVNQDGVWKLLTELFYNQKPIKSRVKELQKMIQEN